MENGGLTISSVVIEYRLGFIELFTVMTLREHPLMSYRRLSNWPPVWTWRGGGQGNKQPRGEVGVLREVYLSKIEPCSQIYMIIEHETEEYMGALLFSDSTFCRQVHELLSKQCGSRIADIGSLDIGEFD